MARRKTSVGEDIMDAVALLPWWAGVAFAIVGYAILHAIAVQPVQVVTSPNQFASSLPGMYLRGIATALQYVLPLFCLAGAAVSYVRRAKRTRLAATTTASPAADVLSDMSWREFEMLTSEAFRLQGFQVEETGGAQADGGVDLRVRRGNETHLVQCKQWRAFKVGVDVVRELYGVMAAQGAAGGFVVTSGQFTAEARAFAEGRNVRLVDGPKLFGMLQQAKRSLEHVHPRGPAARTTTLSTGAALEVAPCCPLCNAAMVRRTARKGANAGSQFWGCSKFPVCRGTR
ncbi:restriction endonuclease [Ramlibacter sp. AN1133]|uniref:restriction endonuclease n=1 Tax=Ramlibacter sp. AN1133 TaxID=3133429 RepID=UPI0030C1F1DE